LVEEFEIFHNHTTSTFHTPQLEPNHGLKFILVFEMRPVYIVPQDYSSYFVDFLKNVMLKLNGLFLTQTIAATGLY